jgi:hypothetical protein
MWRAPLSVTGTTGVVRVVAVGGATSARGSFEPRPELAAADLDVGFTGAFFGAGAGFTAATGLAAATGFGAAGFAAADFVAGLGAAGFGATDFPAGAVLGFGAGFATTLRFAAAGLGAAFFAAAGFLAFAGFFAGLLAGKFAGI